MTHLQVALAIAAGLLSVLVHAASLERHQVSASDQHALALWERPPVQSYQRALVLLLHGRTWSSLPDFHLQVQGEQLSLMDRLSQAGYAVYGLDQRGYGGTERDASGWLTPDRSAEDIASVVHWLRNRHPELPVWGLGWSYGAMQAHLAAAQHPTLFDGLVLYGYPVREGISQGSTAIQPQRAPTTAAAARSDFITQGSISDTAIAAFVEQALDSDPIRADWNRLEQWQSLAEGTLPLPVMLIHGEHDPLTRADVHLRVLERATGSSRQWTILRDSDHAAHLERPAEFTRSVTAFINAQLPNPSKGPRQ